MRSLVVPALALLVASPAHAQHRIPYRCGHITPTPAWRGTACLPGTVLPGGIRPIPANYHVVNPGTYCGYAAVETLAAWRGHDAARGLTPAAYSPNVMGNSHHSAWGPALASRGVPYAPYPIKSFPSPLPYPAVVTVNTSPTGAHAVVALGQTPQCVWVYDPNFPGHHRCIPPPAFQRAWWGDAFHVPRAPTPAPVQLPPIRRR